MRLKAGVRINGMKPEALIGMMICDSIYAEEVLDCVVTSGTEGKHGSSSRPSLHYAGMAFDLRSYYQTASAEQQEALRARLKDALGMDFDVVREPNHYHVEYQPKEEF